MIFRVPFYSFFDTKFIYYYEFIYIYILYQLYYIKYNDILIYLYLNYNNRVLNSINII